MVPQMGVGNNYCFSITLSSLYKIILDLQQSFVNTLPAGEDGVMLEELIEANSAMVDKNLELIKKDMDNKHLRPVEHPPAGVFTFGSGSQLTIQIPLPPATCFSGSASSCTLNNIL